MDKLEEIRADVQRKLFGGRGWLEVGGGQVQVKWLRGHRDAVADIAAYSTEMPTAEIEAVIKNIDGIYETRLIPYDGRLGRERMLRAQVRALMRVDGLDGRPSWPHTPAPRVTPAVTREHDLLPGQVLQQPKRRRTPQVALRLTPALTKAIAVLREANAAGISSAETWLPDLLAELIREATELARDFGNNITEVTPAVTRVCACGCGQLVTSPRPEAKYATGACRVRAHRLR